ncbi:MAG: hypothetical protein ACI9OJ_000488 [Myxococcota bacterium]|jgi:hypothetical protein
MRFGLSLAVVALFATGCGSDEVSSVADGNSAAAENDSSTPVDSADSDLTRCELITRSITAAGFDVDVSCDGTYAWLASDTVPDHEVMTGIVATNEQIPVPAVDYASPLPLNPTKASTYTTVDAALGVAVNGVPIYDYSAQGELDPANYDASVDTVVTGQLDVCNGHAGRGDDYHYHASPTCMIEAMPNKDDNPIIGWGFDGYPLYGHNNPDGSTVADGTLGLCNEQADSTYGWRYHTSVAPPYVFPCLIGEIDDTVLPRVPPLDAEGGGAKPSGTPPQGGVENLVHTRTGDARAMTYSYKGSEYFINYKPGSAANCYDFESNTVTHGADSGTYCR